MSFELNRDESLRKNIRRIVCKQIEGILETLTATDGNQDEAVHSARKSFKKLRAVLRLLRSEIGDKAYHAENICCRDAARPLTEVRDAKILVETLDKLVEHFEDSLASAPFSGLRRHLEDNLDSVRKQVLQRQNAFGSIREVIRQALARVKDWANVRNRWSSLGDGIEETYRRAAAAFDHATKEPTVEKLHEWRKQTKHLRHQLEILRPLWPDRLEEFAGEAQHLGELLGDDHDLAVLREAILAKSLGDEADREALLALIDRRRLELKEEAISLGERFFAEKPKCFVRQLKRYWKAWSDAEPAVAADV